MSEKKDFYKIGEMVGLKEDEVEKIFSRRKIIAFYIIITILFLIIVFFIGNSVFHYADPYAENTLYGTIEARFYKKLKRRAIRAKYNLKQ